MKSETYEYVGPIYMKIDGKSVPVPEVLTQEEVIQLLRLDIDGPKDAANTLLYYREKGLLRATRIGKRIRYSRKEILQFLERQTEVTNRRMEE